MNTQINRAVPIRQHSPRDNVLLNSLPDNHYQQLLGHLALTMMPVGEVVLSYEHPLQHLYFPTTSIFSINYTTKDGASTAVAMIGNEGLVGLSQLLGGSTHTCELVVQSEGHAFRIKKSLLQAEFDKGSVLQHLLLLYAQSLMTQISLTSICNRFHTIEQQLCGWLLRCIDRLNTNTFHATHEQIALNLGVRRESVSMVGHKLHETGIIHSRRGLITVLNRAKLESMVCECYQLGQRENNRLYKSIRCDSSGNHGVIKTVRPRPTSMPVHITPLQKSPDKSIHYL